MTLFHADILHTDILALTLAWGGDWVCRNCILLVLGLLIFGRRLPELGRSVGKTIVEFKKGLSGIESDVNSSATPPAENASNSNGNAALPSNPQNNFQSHQGNPQSNDASNPYSQGQSRPPQP
ncbi:MAG: twin-arginine translocase TatA/TatE family subunit [Planctomycetota bacterium]|nr:twin-arginine translocase TatA/TatE family subunit [Planctomycetota bacterium]